MGSVDVEAPRDFWKETGPEDITVYEGAKIKSRSIGFIWPEEPKYIYMVEK